MNFLGIGVGLVILYLLSVFWRSMTVRDDIAREIADDYVAAQIIAMMNENKDQGEDDE